MLNDQFEGEVLWVSATPMIVGRAYQAKINNTINAQCTITELKYVMASDGETRLAAKTLAAGQRAVVNLQLEPGIEPKCDVTQVKLELIDPDDNNASSTCSLHFALRRSSNIRWQAMAIDRAARENLLQQKGKCIWFTGLSGSGKSTIASAFEQYLYRQGMFTMTLDGDNVRHGLNKDLGFTETDRVENIRRVAEVSKLMVEAGLVVLVSFISPFRAERKLARDLFAPGDFIEVFVDTPLEECERRDVKGLYAKARRGEIKNFTGIDSAYEAPLNPEMRLPTVEMKIEDCCLALAEKLNEVPK